MKITKEWILRNLRKTDWIDEICRSLRGDCDACPIAAEESLSVCGTQCIYVYLSETGERAKESGQEVCLALIEYWKEHEYKLREAELRKFEAEVRKAIARMKRAEKESKS